MQYYLEDNTVKPEYPYLVRAAFGTDYMLFMDESEALDAAEQLCWDRQEPVFLFQRGLDGYGEWRTIKLMSFWDNTDGVNVQEEDYSMELHYKYYTDAGEWLNPPEM